MSKREKKKQQKVLIQVDTLTFLVTLSLTFYEINMFMNENIKKSLSFTIIIASPS